jgi:hypothetical protein
LFLQQFTGHGLRWLTALRLHTLSLSHAQSLEPSELLAFVHRQKGLYLRRLELTGANSVCRDDFVRQLLLGRDGEDSKSDAKDGGAAVAVVAAAATAGSADASDVLASATDAKRQLQPPARAVQRLEHLSLSDRRVTAQSARLLLECAPTLTSLLLERTSVPAADAQRLRERGVAVVFVPR